MKPFHTITRMSSHSHILDNIRQFIPVLTNSLHKGQSGRIGIIGGSREYTGAPYYAAYSALKVGADLSMIFCCEAAASPIKSYSPELIVHPIFKTSEELNTGETETNEYIKKVVEKVTKWTQTLHVLVVGPGLGRDALVLKCVKEIILNAKQSNLPIVLDGDALHLIALEPSIVQDYSAAVLTPNLNEYSRLCEALKIDKNSDLKNLCQRYGYMPCLQCSLGNVTILQKGPTDVISNGSSSIQCSESGGPRRSGGQGDVLAGSVAVFLGWATQYQKRTGKALQCDYPASLLAAYGACFLTRSCNRAAFHKHYRSMTTPNMIEEIGPVFESLFPTANL